MSKISISPVEIRSFRRKIYEHYWKHKRVLRWRTKPTPYFVVVSELMLQQTQVPRVIPKFDAFVKAFPSFKALAAAPLPKLLREWQGLGYNRRALALKKIAMEVEGKHSGRLPESIEKLDALPGIGYATAGSIAAFAFNAPVAFIETNIRTVFIRFFFADKKQVSDEDILPLVVATLDRKNPREWYWALMDYGFFLKKTVSNPSRRSAHYTKQSPFLTSNRRIRGLIVRILTERKNVTAAWLVKTLAQKPEVIEKNLAALQQEGFITRHGRTFRIE